MNGILYTRLDEVVYTVFDFETTGLSYESGHKVVELAFVKFSYRDGIIDEFSTLVNPQRSISLDASNVHSIYDSDVRNAPIFSKFKNKILNLIDGSILVGHNVYFDLRFLKGEMSELGIDIDVPHICTMGFPGFIGGQTKQKLDIICNSKGIPLTDSHSALGDTKATVELLKRHIGDAHKSNLFTFNDLKNVNSGYKFVKSWNSALPSYPSIISIPELLPVARTTKIIPNQRNQKNQRSNQFDYEKATCSIRIRSNPYNENVVDILKSMPVRTYLPSMQQWIIPFRQDYKDYLENLFSAFGELSYYELEIENETLGSSHKIYQVDVTQKNSSSHEGCFIATAVYGGYGKGEVIILRKFRDEFLLHTKAGCIFVKLYYRFSPFVAKITMKCSLLKLGLKIILDQIVKLLSTFFKS